MNEGENTGMPKSPDFSSPNNPPKNSASASVYSAAASLPDEDPSQPTQSISSGKPARPRLGFSRKFKESQPTQPRANTFSNAPEFFNQAVGDIVLANDNAKAQKKKNKKFAILAAIVLGALAITIVVILVVSGINQPSANKVKTAFNRYANYVLYGEEKDSNIGEYDESAHYTIMDKLVNTDDNYNKRLKELFDIFYKAYNAAAESGLYEKGGMNDYKWIVYDTYLSIYLEDALPEDELAEKFSEEGAEGLRSLVNAKTESLRDFQESSYIKAWADARLSFIAVLEYESKFSCYLGDPSNKAKCDVKPTSGEVSAMETAYSNYKQSVQDQEYYEKISTQGIINYIFDYRGAFDGKKK